MKRNTLLIVDDCPVYQQTAKSMAEKRGYNVELMGDGLDAIIRMRQDINDVCAILLDIFMPQVDGISALGQIRNRHPEIPIIVITSTEDKEIIEAAQSLGAEAIIEKPVTPEKIEPIFTLIESRWK